MRTHKQRSGDLNKKQSLEVGDTPWQAKWFALWLEQADDLPRGEGLDRGAVGKSW